MSFVHLLAADRPLPLCDRRSFRRIMFSQHTWISGEFGFCAQECAYYPHEMAHCPLKPYYYDLPDLIHDSQTLADLCSYLRQALPSGSEAELWHIWLDSTPLRRELPRYRGSLAGLDLDAFSQLFEDSECCLIVEI